MLTLFFNKKSFEINNYQNLNINNLYWIILYLIDRIYFVIILLIIWFFIIFLRIKFIYLKIKNFILRQKINYKDICCFYLINWIKFNKIILITNIKKTMRLIEFKRGHFPYLFLKIN